MSENQSNDLGTQQTLMLAYLCTRDIEEFGDQLAVLDKFDLADEQIAKICGKAVGTVRNTRSLNKQGKGKK